MLSKAGLDTMAALFDSDGSVDGRLPARNDTRREAPNSFLFDFKIIKG